MDMDKMFGVENRMAKVGNNLRKFNQLEGEKANLQPYHNELIKLGLEKIKERGGRELCRELGEKYDKSSETIRSDMLIMKMYGLIV
jgi:hypothetical protein